MCEKKSPPGPVVPLRRLITRFCVLSLFCPVLSLAKEPHHGTGVGLPAPGRDARGTHWAARAARSRRHASPRRRRRSRLHGGRKRKKSSEQVRLRIPAPPAARRPGDKKTLSDCSDRRILTPRGAVPAAAAMPRGGAGAGGPARSRAGLLRCSAVFCGVLRSSLAVLSRSILFRRFCPPRAVPLVGHFEAAAPSTGRVGTARSRPNF